MTSKSVRQLIVPLEPLGDDFKCPICFEILQEPHLTTCCGIHHLCKSCMETVKKAKDRCPLCRESPLNGFIDKRFERQLNELKVYCIYKEKGCKWIGGFGKIDEHLNIGKESGECQFVVLKCPVSVECKEYVSRKELKNHKLSICKYRQLQCIYCGFVSTYQKINTLHISRCIKYPMICPNKCSDQIYPRDQLRTHLASCPEQEVDCTFSEMGCKEKVKRQLLQSHLNNNLLQHQVIMCQAFKEIKKDKQEVEEELESLKKDKEELEKKINEMVKSLNQESNVMKSLKQIVMRKDQSLYFSKMAEFSNSNPVAPLVFKASFEITKQDNHYTAKPYYSQFFYSHPNGYKLQLSAEGTCGCSICTKSQELKTAVVQSQKLPPQQSTGDAWQNGNFRSFCQSSRHPQQYCIVPSRSLGRQIFLMVNLFIFKGDYDPLLKWPFEEKVAITFFQQNYNAVDSETTIKGNQNYSSTGTKLSIKSLAERNEGEGDLVEPFIQLPSEQGTSLDAQAYGRPQQKASIYKEKILTFPLKVHHRGFGSLQTNTYNETVYFEVTFSP